MSVNNPRSTKCKVCGCDRNPTACGLCLDHWNEYCVEVLTKPSSDEDTQPVPNFDVDCARAFDRQPCVEVLDVRGNVMYMAKSRTITPSEWARNGNGRTR